MNAVAANSQSGRFSISTLTRFAILRKRRHSSSLASSSTLRWSRERNYSLRWLWMTWILMKRASVRDRMVWYNWLCTSLLMWRSPLKKLIRTRWRLPKWKRRFKERFRSKSSWNMSTLCAYTPVLKMTVLFTWFSSMSNKVTCFLSSAKKACSARPKHFTSLSRQ